MSFHGGAGTNRILGNMGFGFAARARRFRNLCKMRNPTSGKYNRVYRTKPLRAWTPLDYKRFCIIAKSSEARQ